MQYLPRDADLGGAAIPEPTPAIRSGSLTALTSVDRLSSICVPRPPLGTCGRPAQDAVNRAARGISVGALFRAGQP